VTSQMEAEEVRQLGLRNALAIIPNGLSLPAESPLRMRSPRRKRALFLSRIHPKKGVLNLISAWAIVRPQGWTLVIAGPNDAGHREEAESLARREGISDSTEFLGPVADDAKWQVYAAADLDR